LTNLGNVYRDLGDIDKAKELIERALLIEERHYGSEHPQVAITLYNLAETEASLNNISSCLVHSKRCLDIFMTHFGADHPDTKDAKKLYKQCLSREHKGKASVRAKKKPIQQTKPKSQKNKKRKNNKSECSLC
jgi:tetratricopeptide (TPR) repeat protein